MTEINRGNVAYICHTHNFEILELVTKIICLPNHSDQAKWIGQLVSIFINITTKYPLHKFEYSWFFELYGCAYESHIISIRNKFVESTGDSSIYNHPIKEIVDKINDFRFNLQFLYFNYDRLLTKDDIMEAINHLIK